MANKAQANLKYHKGYGENFKSLRMTHRINGKPCTVRQLSKVFSDNGIGISYSTISDIENESREPTVEQVQIYHDFFNVPFDFLTGETKTQKKSLIDICNYTGLSEQAVNMLHKLAINYTDDDDKSPITKDELQNLKNKNIKILEILNYLLANTENRNLFDSLSMIEKYEKIYKEVIYDAKVECGESVSDVSQYPIQFENDLTFCENFAKNLRFAKSYYFDAIEYFKETMNLYVKSHITSQETEAVIRKIEGLNYGAEKEKRDYYEFLLYVQEGD